MEGHVEPSILKTAKNIYTKCENGKMAIRTRIAINKRKGRSDKEVAEFLGVSVPTVSRWWKRFKEEGLEGLKDRERSGRPREVEYERVREALSKDPRECGFEIPAWTPDILHEWIKKNWATITTKITFTSL